MIKKSPRVFATSTTLYSQHTVFLAEAVLACLATAKRERKIIPAAAADANTTIFYLGLLLLCDFPKKKIRCTRTNHGNCGRTHTTIKNCPPDLFSSKVCESPRAFDMPCTANAFFIFSRDFHHKYWCVYQTSKLIIFFLSRRTSSFCSAESQT